MITGNVPTDGYGVIVDELSNVPTNGYGSGFLIPTGGVVIDEAEAVLTDFNTFVELVADLESAFEPVVEQTIEATAVEMRLRASETLDLDLTVTPATELTINETQLDLDNGAETVTAMSTLVEGDLELTVTAEDAAALEDEQTPTATLDDDTDLAGA